SDLSAIPTEIRNKTILKSVPYTEVANHLMVADLGFVFYKEGYSLIGRYPTKLGEYWSCGLPCLVYKKIGDINSLIDKFPLYGFYYFNYEELEFKMESFNLDIDKNEIRMASISEFSLKKGVEFYNNVYKEILE